MSFIMPVQGPKPVRRRDNSNKKKNPLLSPSRKNIGSRLKNETSDDIKIDISEEIPPSQVKATQLLEEPSLYLGENYKEEIPVIQEETKEEIPVIQEETKEEIPVIQEETKEEPSVIQEETKEEIPVIQEETKEEIPVIQEETKEEIPVIQEETKEEPSVIQKETKEEPSVIQKETKEEPSVIQEESKEESSISQGESKEESSVSQEDSKEESSISQGESKEESSISQGESKEKTPVIQENSKEETPVIQEESLASQGESKEESSVSQEDSKEETLPVQEEYVIQIGPEEEPLVIQEKSSFLQKDSPETNFIPKRPIVEEFHENIEEEKKSVSFSNNIVQECPKEPEKESICKITEIERMRSPYELFFSSLPILIDEKGLCFTPKDVNFMKYKTYPCSNYNPKLLSRSVYLSREQHKEDIQRFNVIFTALSFAPKEDYYVNLSEGDYYLPLLLEIKSEGVKIPCYEKYFLVGSYICLFPGKVKDGIYISTLTSDVLQLLDDKQNYDVGTPRIDITEFITLEELELQLISYLRTKIKRSLLISSEADIYSLSDDNLFPLEREPNLLLNEFSLLYTNLTQEVTLYLDDDAIFEEKDGLFLVKPTFANEDIIDGYSIPFWVEMRALHLNYVFQIVDDSYEDFLGEPKWIVAPVKITKHNNELHGSVVYPMYYFT